MKQKQADQAGENILYRYCIPEWRTVVDTGRELRSVKKGQPVFSEKDIVQGVFFIDTGKVKIHQRWGDEKELIIRFAKNGDMLGYRGLGKEKVYPVSATALEDTTLVYLDIRLFEATLQVNPRLTYALMDFYANELEATERRVRNMAHMEVKGRVAEAITMLKRDFGVNEQGFIDIKLTRQDMASYVGTTYETISRMISELEAEKLIRTSGKNIAVLNEKQLEQLL
ncbi:Crp/Fnr family transcriptional regulator [Niabella drilacis]|uniref:cAMP-binding domain of CRP or a regulatory subunit of cAMP-dependent protein kinases n=1 Tax=Niabella drilacis (strain DSM 25811 / CCM 8410 / CCUG 62505 / LMG 26954 / E90) TaxID=1285928 RepID=A0A1G6KNF4_NIADE|nr:Crp/Fnr family transcriptional regulator [Niabella drilacis]SDC32358.1 cAMP-binding domain of CRP or a regulatory subunit of cAMP-dependent protein kinases [Niabella drilacis]